MSNDSSGAVTVSSEPARNRWVIALAGVTMMLMLGSIYAWSVFKNPLIKGHGWSEHGVGFTFSVAIFCMGLSAAIGGRFVDRAGSRRIATVAALLFGTGAILAGVADRIGSLWLLWIGYGVIAGIGGGLGYVTPVAVLVRWFPDRKGLITGLAVMGFGLGAAAMGKIAPLTIERWGIDNTLYGAGALFLVVMLIAARKLVNPPPGWAPAAQARTTALISSASLDFKAARKTYQFYILWFILFLNVTVGIALISNLSPLAQQQLQVDAAAAGTIIFVSSLFNGLGRLFWAWLSERFGRKPVFLAIFATQIPMFLILPHVASVWLFSGIVCYILLCYGGGFGTMPAFAADTFGPKNMGAIYGPILLAWGLAGAAGPMLMEWIKLRSGNFTTALVIAAALLGIGFVITLLYRKPRVKAPAVAEPAP